MRYTNFHAVHGTCQNCDSRFSNFTFSSNFIIFKKPQLQKDSIAVVELSQISLSVPILFFKNPQCSSGTFRFNFPFQFYFCKNPSAVLELS